MGFLISETLTNCPAETMEQTLLYIVVGIFLLLIFYIDSKFIRVPLCSILIGTAVIAFGIISWSCHYYISVFFAGFGAVYIVYSMVS